MEQITGRTSGVLDAATDDLSLSTRAIHADDGFSGYQDIAPALHVSTTYKYPRNPDELIPQQEIRYEPGTYIYSRESAPNYTRLESILTSLIGGPTLTYASGLAAVNAFYVLTNPKRAFITGGYHGCHEILKIFKRLTSLEQFNLSEVDKAGPGDIIHVETPLNPTGEALNLKYYADKAHERGAYLFVDATFGPPGLQDPFEWGADAIMHSGTKYFGGHSDMLCGTLSVHPDKKDTWFKQLFFERMILGNVLGSLEGWLGVRSLRTLQIRVQKQSQSATKLVEWLHESLQAGGDNPVAKTVAKITHASLQKDDMEWLSRQMPNGFGPVFSLEMKDGRYGKTLPSKLDLFQHATSLGGVESLVEWRTMSDHMVSQAVLRFSIGIEDFRDLKNDLEGGFKRLLEDDSQKKEEPVNVI